MGRKIYEIPLDPKIIRRITQICEEKEGNHETCLIDTIEKFLWHGIINHKLIENNTY